jgi:hypothetical protein
MGWKDRIQKEEVKKSSWKDRIQPEAEQIGQGESGLRGLAQGASLGFADEITGAAESLFTDKTYEQARNESRDAYKQAQEANPLTYGAGELGGAIGTAFIPGLGAASGAKLAAVAGKAALQGGIAGLGNSEAESVGDMARDAAVGAGTGAAGGAIGYGLGKGIQAGFSKLSKAAPGVADKLDDVAEVQAARALGLERGTMKSLGNDEVRRIGRFALDESVITPFNNTDDMIARTEALKRLGGDTMEGVYSKIDDAGASTFNPLNVAGEVDDKIGGFYRSPINRGETNQLENTLESILMRGDKDISLKDAQILKEELGKVANWKNSLNVTDKERMARDAYGIVNKAIDSSADDASILIGDDTLRSTLKQGKELYSKATGAEKLLNNKIAKEQGNKLFGLTDMAVGGPGAVASLLNPALAVPTAAAIAIKKGAEKFGNQVTAISADRLSDVVRQAPQRLGKFAPVLQKAAERGGQALAVANFVLQQNNPEYREHVKTLEKDEE